MLGFSNNQHRHIFFVEARILSKTKLKVAERSACKIYGGKMVLDIANNQVLETPNVPAMMPDDGPATRNDVSLMFAI